MYAGGIVVPFKVDRNPIWNWIVSFDELISITVYLNNNTNLLFNKNCRQYYSN